MTAVKKKLLIALAFVAMLFAGIALLSACSGNGRHNLLGSRQELQLHRRDTGKQRYKN